MSSLIVNINWILQLTKSMSKYFRQKENTLLLDHLFVRLFKKFLTQYKPKKM